MDVSGLLYNLKVCFAHIFLPKDSTTFTTTVNVGGCRDAEIALCKRTPYYRGLAAKIRDAQAYIGLSDEMLHRYRLRFVPDWFVVLDDKQEPLLVMGAVLEPFGVAVSFKGPHETDWEWTLCHEFAHLYCKEHPGMAPDGSYDYYHESPVWDRVKVYRYPGK